jgi:NADPH:quinone reductase-like Zn-dependent oxidoreductase
MSKIADRIERLSPQKRAMLLRQLREREGWSPAPLDTSPARWKTVHAGRGDNFQAVVTAPGDIGSLEFQPTLCPPPPPGMIQIRIKAMSLNFRDLMIALGLYPSGSRSSEVMGSDCVGTVVAIGDRLDTYPIDGIDFRIDAPTMAIGQDVVACPGKFRSSETNFSPIINVWAFEAAPLPRRLTPRQAAGIPTAFCTAFYGLHMLARLQPGETALVQSAASGVGLAAVQVCRWLGAEVLATAGTPEKRAYLASIGVKHVMDSRSLDFGNEVMEITRGRGVDVVLNSLPGPAIAAGLAVLGDFGRFIEIGKRDIMQDARIGLKPFSRGLSFAAVDLGLFLKRPPLIIGAMQQILSLVEAGVFAPLPDEVYPIKDLAAALLRMSEGRHIGKLIVNFEGQTVQVRSGPQRGG